MKPYLPAMGLSFVCIQSTISYKWPTKKPHRRNDEALCSCDAVIDDSFTPIHRAKTPPFVLTPCVQIVLTTYTYNTRNAIAVRFAAEEIWYGVA